MGFLHQLFATLIISLFHLWFGEGWYASTYWLKFWFLILVNVVTVAIMDLEDTYFPSVFHEGYSNLDQQFTQSQHPSQVGEMTQKESQYSVQTKPVAKKRGANFTIEEDIMLVSAWLNTSLDPIRGNEQKQKTFWMRVWEYFHENKTFTSERNENSLMNRWSIIQLGTNKFCGYLAQIEAAHPSGMTEEDKPVFSPSVLAEIVRPNGTSTNTVSSGESLSAELALELISVL